MKPKSIEKRAAVRSAVLSTLFQVMAAGALLYLRTLSPPDWLGGLLLILAVSDLAAIPFTFAALRQRVREIEKGELEEAKKY